MDSFKQLTEDQKDKIKFFINLIYVNTNIEFVGSFGGTVVGITVPNDADAARPNTFINLHWLYLFLLLVNKIYYPLNMESKLFVKETSDCLYDMFSFSVFETGDHPIDSLYKYYINNEKTIKERITEKSILG